MGVLHVGLGKCQRQLSFSLAQFLGLNRLLIDRDAKIHVKQEGFPIIQISKWGPPVSAHMSDLCAEVHAHLITGYACSDSGEGRYVSTSDTGVTRWINSVDICLS